MHCFIEHSSFVVPPQAFFPACHASTILPVPGGFLCAFFAGAKEGAPDVKIWLAKREGEKWLPPRVVASDPQFPCWNPVLFQWGGQIQLYYKIGPSCDRWQSWRIVSLDGGETFSPPEKLPSCRGPVKNKPILLSNGLLCAPGSNEEDGIWDAFCDSSRDGGRTWLLGYCVPFEHASAKGPGIIQPTLWEDPSGGLHMLARSGEGCLFAADSADSGRTWTPARPMPLPNNNSGVDLCALPDGLLVLACNPITGNWAARNRLCLLFSRDGGQTFAEPFFLEEDSDTTAEYSYPAILPCPGGVVLSYTWRRRSIRFLQISISC